MTGVLVAVLALAVVSFAAAGIEPVPWTPATNVLNSVVNVLWEVDHQLNVLQPLDPARPPNPCINELDALTKQLQKQNGRVEGVLAMVETNPEPPDDFVQALLDIRLAAVGDPDLRVPGIAGDTGVAPTSPPPGDDDPVGQALYRLYQAAVEIGDTVDGYLYPTIPGTDG